MSDKPATAQGEAAGAAIKGLFGAGAFAIVYAFIALIKGAMHINEKEVACPWSPGLIDFLLTYGIINISLPVLCIIMVLVGYCLRDTVGTKIIGFIFYVPVISYVVGFGLSIWGTYNTKEEVSLLSKFFKNEIRKTNLFFYRFGVALLKLRFRHICIQ